MLVFIPDSMDTNVDTSINRYSIIIKGRLGCQDMVHKKSSESVWERKGE